MEKHAACQYKCQGYTMDFCCGEFCELLITQRKHHTEGCQVCQVSGFHVLDEGGYLTMSEKISNAE